MRPLGLSRGSIRLVRTVSNGGRSAKTRFSPSTSRGRGRALTPVRGIEILELLGLCEDTTRLPGRATQARQGPLGPGRTEGQDHLRPGGVVRETELLLERAVRGIGGRRTPSPKSPRRQSPAGPADRSCWEYAKTGKCQHGRDCRFEHDKSPRNPAAPSTPRTGDRPVWGQAHVLWVLLRLDVWQVHRSAMQILASEAASGHEAHHASYHCRSCR